LIEDRVEDSVTTREYQSNSEARDVEPISETEQNDNEQSISEKCGSPRRSVSMLLMNPFFKWNISNVNDFLQIILQT
jgi:hypothetical protein